jgi:hypothetical protein
MSDTQQTVTDVSPDNNGNETAPTLALDDSGDVELPVIDVLSGRGFLTGKSGSGKSNSASVVFEELLDHPEGPYPFLVVDTDGEYWGLREEYELLHLGGDDECQARVGPEHAEWIAETVLVDRVPIILDVSGYADEGGADVDSNIGRELLEEVATALFTKAKAHKQPMLFALEEIHEFIPEGGGLDSLGQRLIKVAKRGRKHGLGLMGMSQRPADVKKSFITQCDWLLWHRLTWNNDTNVVKNVLGSEYADAIEDFDDGEAWLMTDWDGDITRVCVRRKHTFDAGGRPGLEGIDRPDLKGVDEGLLDGLEEASEQAAKRRDRISQLEYQLEEKDETIEELKQDLREAENLNAMAEKFSDAMLQQAEGQTADPEADSGGPPDVIRAEVMEIRQEKQELESEVEAKDDRIEELEARVAELEPYEERVERLERRVDFDEAEEAIERLLEALDVDADPDDRIRQKLSEEREQRQQLEARLEELQREDTPAATGDDAGLSTLLEHDGVQSAIETAKEAGDHSDEHFDRVLTILASSDGSAKTAADVAPLTDVSERTVRGVMSELHRSGILQTETQGRATAYRLDREFLERRIEVAEQQPNYN